MTTTTTTTTTTRLGTPLTEQAIRHVNFFNGRLVTQGDMARTQEAQHEADTRLGQGIGSGVVHGLEISIADAAQRQLRVTAGLGISAAGQALCLGTEQLLALAPTPEPGKVETSGGFGDFGRCGTLAGGGYVAGNGLYLLTLAPLSIKLGKAPVLALDPGNAACNSDAIVEAVQLRLLRIENTLLDALGLATNPVGAAAISKWRSAVAHACFGYPALATAHAQNGVPPANGGLLQQLRTSSLSDCELPLGLVYLTASAGIAFIDAWAVRRRVAGEPASQAWSAWFGPGLDALGEAQLAQFQQQLSEIPTGSLAGLKAADWFAWLPPAGFLDASGTRRVDGPAFLDARKPARTVSLAPGDVRALLGQALRRDAVKLGLAGDRPRFRLYAVDGGPQLFVREAPNAPHAEEVWLDGQRARLPGVNDVQSAIDELRARVCGERSVWPGMDAQALIDGLASGADLTLCFEAGHYALAGPLRLADLGHLVIRGNGAASLLSCSSGEAALIISDCDSLTISDLAVEGGRIGPGKGELGLGLLGALTVVDVPSVHIERLSANCDDAAAPGAACIVVRQSVAVAVAAVAAAAATEAVEASDTFVNRLSAFGLSGAEKAGDASGDEAERRRQLRLLKRAKNKGGADKKSELPEASHVCIVDCDLQIGAAQIGILCSNNALTEIRHNRLRGRYRLQPPERGIVVAGSSATLVTIAHNSVIHAAQGIAIGLSRSDAPNSAPLSVERASVLDNQVQIGLGERDLTRNRFGIFVGNARSLAVEGNRVTQPEAALTGKISLEAIRLSGAYGLMLYVRGNHMSGTSTGIGFSPLAPLPELDANKPRKNASACLWLFEGNLAEQATEVIKADAAAQDLITDVLNLAV
ncbi:MAG: right-handed parallel beta-helix repeat-containing protein [Paucibacter sp.]|nr:right-handed parallel beta-helix repeat-containing protein [Roseateles sp.]